MLNVTRRGSFLAALNAGILFTIIILFFVFFPLNTSYGSGTSASDAFGRTTSNGWGTADTGGSWTPVTGTAADFSTNGSTATASVPSAGANRAIYLNSVSAQEVDMLVKFQTNKTATGGVERFYLVGRRISSGNEYRGRVTINTSGSVQIQGTALVSSSESTIGSGVTVSGITFAANTNYWVRTTLTGTNPTTIAMKFWADGSGEPGSFQYSQTDSSSVLQAAGAVGIQSTLAAAASNAPVAFTYDDYSVTNTDPTPTPTVSPTPTTAPTGDPVIAAAGDIVCGLATPGGASCKHQQTSDLIVNMNPHAVLPLGDIQYEEGDYSDFLTYYEPTWGRFKNITYPVIGNHEYLSTATASGYFDYYNGIGVTTGQAGTRGQGYYSFNLGDWHLVALNSNCTKAGGCGVGSPQETWLRADLAAHPNKCILAYAHHPWFSSGQENKVPAFQPLMQALYEYHTDIFLSGHDHDYERFALQDVNGAADANGIKQFVVGTGGRSFTGLGDNGQIANSELFDNTSMGVLKVTLHSTTYNWQFIPASGYTFTDSGVQSCHNRTASTNSSTNSTNSGSESDPNVITGWKYRILAGPHHVGNTVFINGVNEANNSQLFIPTTSFHDDVYAIVEKKTTTHLQNETTPIPFPWSQGFNTAGEIYQVSILSAFNGYPIVKADQPYTIIFPYDSLRLYTYPAQKLRIGWYNPEKSRWQVLTQNTVVNEITKTVANTTSETGYFTVVYPK